MMMRSHSTPRATSRKAPSRIFSSYAKGYSLRRAFRAISLKGITRDSIIQVARSLQIPVEERAVDRSELYIADEAFLCGSSARLIPILSVDKRIIGSGTMGPVTKKLSDQYDTIQKGGGLASEKNWVLKI